MAPPGSISAVDSASEARTLGDFELHEKLGEGGFGTVYRAEQRTLGRPAVVKVMRESLATRRDAIEKAQRREVENSELRIQNSETAIRT